MYSASRPVATVSRQLIHTVLDAAVAAGVARRAVADALRTRLEIGMGGSSVRTQRLPERALRVIWESIISLAGGDHGVGILLALHADDRAFGVVGEAIRQAPTLMSAFEHIARYSRLVHQGVTFTVESSSRDVVVSYALAGAGSGPMVGSRAAGMLWAIGNLALVPRRSFGMNLRPLSVEISCPRPADLGLAKEVFGVRISFGAATSRLVFDRRAVEAAQRPAGGSVLAYLDELAERDLGDLPSAHDVVAIVTIELHRGLVGGVLKIDAVARSLGLSSRTLQRRISEAGSSFASILDDVRKARATELIAVGEHAMSEIAYLLGYSEQAAFSRASRRWFGVAPSRIGRQS